MTLQSELNKQLQDAQRLAYNPTAGLSIPAQIQRRQALTGTPTARIFETKSGRAYDTSKQEYIKSIQTSINEVNQKIAEGYVVTESTDANGVKSYSFQKPNYEIDYNSIKQSAQNISTETGQSYDDVYNKLLSDAQSDQSKYESMWSSIHSSYEGQSALDAFNNSWNSYVSSKPKLTFDYVNKSVNITEPIQQYIRPGASQSEIYDTIINNIRTAVLSYQDQGIQQSDPQMQKMMSQEADLINYKKMGAIITPELDANGKVLSYNISINSDKATTFFANFIADMKKQGYTQETINRVVGDMATKYNFDLSLLTTKPSTTPTSTSPPPTYPAPVPIPSYTGAGFNIGFGNYEPLSVTPGTGKGFNVAFGNTEVTQATPEQLQGLNTLIKTRDKMASMGIKTTTLDSQINKLLEKYGLGYIPTLTPLESGTYTIASIMASTPPGKEYNQLNQLKGLGYDLLKYDSKTKNFTIVYPTPKELDKKGNTSIDDYARSYALYYYGNPAAAPQMKKEFEYWSSDPVSVGTSLASYYILYGKLGDLPYDIYNKFFKISNTGSPVIIGGAKPSIKLREKVDLFRWWLDYDVTQKNLAARVQKGGYLEAYKFQLLENPTTLPLWGAAAAGGLVVAPVITSTILTTTGIYGGAQVAKQIYENPEETPRILSNVGVQSMLFGAGMGFGKGYKGAKAIGEGYGFEPKIVKWTYGKGIEGVRAVESYTGGQFKVPFTRLTAETKVGGRSLLWEQGKLIPKPLTASLEYGVTRVGKTLLGKRYHPQEGEFEPGTIPTEENLWKATKQYPSVSTPEEYVKGFEQGGVHGTTAYPKVYKPVAELTNILDKSFKRTTDQPLRQVFKTFNKEDQTILDSLRSDPNAVLGGSSAMKLQSALSLDKIKRFWRKSPDKDLLYIGNEPQAKAYAYNLADSLSRRTGKNYTVSVTRLKSHITYHIKLGAKTIVDITVDFPQTGFIGMRERIELEGHIRTIDGINIADMQWLTLNKIEIAALRGIKGGNIIEKAINDLKITTGKKVPEMLLESRGYQEGTLWKRGKLQTFEESLRQTTGIPKKKFTIGYGEREGPQVQTFHEYPRGRAARWPLGLDKTGTRQSMIRRGYVERPSLFTSIEKGVNVDARLIDAAKTGPDAYLHMRNLIKNEYILRGETAPPFITYKTALRLYKQGIPAEFERGWTIGTERAFGYKPGEGRVSFNVEPPKTKLGKVYDWYGEQWSKLLKTRDYTVDIPTGRGIDIYPTSKVIKKPPIVTPGILDNIYGKGIGKISSKVSGIKTAKSGVITEFEMGENILRIQKGAGIKYEPVISERQTKYLTGTRYQPPYQPSKQYQIHPSTKPSYEYNYKPSKKVPSYIYETKPAYEYPRKSKYKYPYKYEEPYRYNEPYAYNYPYKYKYKTTPPYPTYGRPYPYSYKYPRPTKYQYPKPRKGERPAERKRPKVKKVKQGKGYYEHFYEIENILYPGRGIPEPVNVYTSPKFELNIPKGKFTFKAPKRRTDLIKIR